MKIDPTGKYILLHITDPAEVKVIEINHDRTSRELGSVISRFELD
jgi:hypothetical protein